MPTSTDDTSALLESINASANAVFSVARSSHDQNNPESRSQFCYVLRSCAKRMVDNVECTLGKNNFLDMKMFVPRLDDCRVHCLETEGCRYYHWYSIGRSDKPRYCYLFRQCAAKDEEPEVRLHYFKKK